MKIVVTGSEGFIGSHLVEELKAHGHDIVGLDIKAEDPTDVTEFDLLLDTFPKEADCVIHLAAKPGVAWSVDNPSECYVQNVVGTENVLRVATLMKAKRLVFASSSTVYGATATPWSETSPLSPISPYGETKVAGERACEYYARHCGLPCTVLRLFSVYGPRMRSDLAMRRLADSLLPEKPVFHIRGDGSSARDYTHVSDVVRAFRVVVERQLDGFNVFNICAGRPVELQDTIVTLEGWLGTPVNKIWDCTPVADWEPNITYGDNSKACNMLGWKPFVAFPDGLRTFTDWWISQTGWKQ